LEERKYGLTRPYEFFYDRTRNMWPFNTGDCFIEVTTLAGLTVYTCCVIYNNRSQSFRNRIKFACMQHKTGWNMAKIACMRPPETGLCNARLADTKSYNTRLAETRTKIHYFKHYMIHWNQDQNSSFQTLHVSFFTKYCRWINVQMYYVK
jgi:hypothetical protein